MRTKEFYKFMQKRETIRLHKENGMPWPWTDDPILREYKFTNVKRAHDRTTRWFWENALDPHAKDPLEVQLFNCALFRYFGTIEFFEAIGWHSHWNADKADRVKATAHLRLLDKKRVFTGAYVITNQGIKAPKQNVVVDYFLTPLWETCPLLVQIAQESKSWEAVANSMMQLKGFGGTGFMTKEILQDAIHTPVLHSCTDRNTWCPVGPGAKRGINRILEQPVKSTLKGNDGLVIMQKLFEMRWKHWPENFVELELHDIQFQLCEFDKYERVKHGEGRPRSRYRWPG